MKEVTKKIAINYSKIESGAILVKCNKYGKRVRGENNFCREIDPHEVEIKKTVDFSEVIRPQTA